MNWSRMRRHRSVPRSPWSPEEVAVLARAVGHAPAVHATPPWWLEVHRQTAVLWERPNGRSQGRDPDGRDRLLSSGAALTNLILAARGLGWATEHASYGLASVTAVRPEPPTPTETRLFRAIDRRVNHRGFAPEPVSGEQVRILLEAGADEGVRLRQVQDTADVTALANMLVYSAVAHRHDDPCVTSQPDRDVLATRIARESVFVLSTPEDGPDDHLRAGAAMQRMWLTATALGLAASVLTQPLHLREFRCALARRLELEASPQVLIRIGHPTAAVRCPDGYSSVTHGRIIPLPSW